MVDLSPGASVAVSMRLEDGHGIEDTDVCELVAWSNRGAGLHQRAEHRFDPPT